MIIETIGILEFSLIALDIYQNEPRHVISNNVAFWQVKTQASMWILLLSLETPNHFRSVAVEP